MIIVIVDTTLQGPLIGGAQTFLPNLLKGLVERGHKVHLVSAGRPDERVQPALESSGVVLHDTIWDNNMLEQDAAVSLAGWVNKMNPDLYLVSVSPDIGWLALPLLDPTIATMAIGHTDSETFYQPVRHYHSFLTKVVGVSKQVSDQFISSCQISPGDTRWIPYGVTINLLPPTQDKEGPLKLVYVGRLEEQQKRVSDIIKIIHHLSERGLSFQFSIIGDGTERNKMEEALQMEIDSGSVKFHGWLAPSEVIASMRESSIFILTSAYEGFCIALVEAMANGCCPIVTNIQSGNEQLIKNGFSGFIFPVGDTISFANKIADLSKDLTCLHTLRKRAWETGMNFSIEKMVDAFENYFSEAIIQNGKSLREADRRFPPMPGCRSAYPLWIRRIKKQIFH